jgi:hypothetical protein
VEIEHFGCQQKGLLDVFARLRAGFHVVVDVVFALKLLGLLDGHFAVIVPVTHVPDQHHDHVCV